VREKLNENPIAQVALVGVLVVLAAVFFLKSSGGEEEEAVAPTEATVAVAGTEVSGTATGATPGEAVEGAVESAEGALEASLSAAPPSSVPTPQPPRPLTAAYDAGKTVVLLIVHPGGIDDKLIARSTSLLATNPDVALFVVPDRQIARYAAITIGLGVNRVPALVVMKPKRLSRGTPQASVEYGFQTPQGVVQTVEDAAYSGPEVSYHPN
jgi:hypothetical protein